MEFPSDNHFVMEPETIVFALPTYRLREVAETIEAYDANNVSRIVDDVVGQIQASLEIRPKLVEVCCHHKDKKPLPQIGVKDKRLETCC